MLRPLVDGGCEYFLFYTNRLDGSCDALNRELIEDLFQFFSTRNGEQPS
jgi:hypothetical protein